MAAFSVISKRLEDRRNASFADRRDPEVVFHLFSTPLYRTLTDRSDGGAAVEKRAAERSHLGYKGVTTFFSLRPPYDTTGDELHWFLLGIGKTIIRGTAEENLSGI